MCGNYSSILVMPNFAFNILSYNVSNFWIFSRGLFPAFLNVYKKCVRTLPLRVRSGRGYH